MGCLKIHKKKYDFKSDPLFIRTYLLYFLKSQCQNQIAERGEKLAQGPKGC